MNDRRHDAAYWLARYADEERPPPEVDLRIRARLQRHGYHRTHTLWAGAALLAAAVVLMLVRNAGSESSVHARSLDFTALHTATSPNKRIVVESRPDSDPRSVPRALGPVPATDAATLVLNDATRAIAAGDYAAALARLSPCRQTVGTDDLLEECEFLIIKARCRSHQIAFDDPQIAAFRQHWPDSFHTRQFDRDCSR